MVQKTANVILLTYFRKNVSMINISNSKQTELSKIAGMKNSFSQIIHTDDSQNYRVIDF